ncbi:MAG: glutaredoxin family protein [bacterium]|nr:glutaredoxin family protein [bacterium]
MKNVIIYTTPGCIYCKVAKDFFDENNVKYTEYDLSEDAEKRDEMVKKTGQMSVPMIEIGDDIVVGFDKKEVSRLLGI